ncbi:MAG: hypothetical protein WCK90_00645 [archaeon]
MGLMEEVQGMQEQGMQESDIVRKLEGMGFPAEEIKDTISQTKIKGAVSGTNTDEGMQPSMMSQQESQEASETSYPSEQDQQQQAPHEQYALPAPGAAVSDQQYQGYQPTQISSDTIAEIAEQVTMEKLGSIRQYLEKTLDMKNTFESKMDSLSERLQRIEKIIDRLQLSILQKVGEYVTNVEDIKKEMQDTQSSFKAMMDEKHPSKVQKKSE